MADDAVSPAVSPGPPQGDGDPGLKKKKKDKVRGAWISFFGRIFAQIIGAVASVLLAIFVLQRYQAQRDTTSTPAPEPAVMRVSSPRAAGEVALAVLPLDNLSADPAQDYFVDGITEALIADLAQIEGLRVISRTSTVQYKDRRKSVPQVAQELAVDLVVEGSVARVGDRVRVTAQLIDARSDEHIWARSYDRTLRDVLALQGEMATAIAGELRGAITPRQQGRLSQRRPIDPAVYDVYLRGRQAWNLRTPEGFDNAIRYFAEAVKKDPEFALGFAGLADAYSLQANLPSDPGGVGAAMANAKAAAERALALDEGLAEAHTSLGAVLFFGERNFDGADRAFRRALELNAGYPTAHQWIAILLAERGLDAEATGHAQQAVSLDPLSGTMHQTLGLVHYFGRRYALAAAEARRALDLGPGLALPRVILAKALILQGDWKAAIDVCEQAPSPRSPDLLAAMSLAHLRAGDRQRAEAILREVTSREPLPVAALAQYHAAAGNASAALDMLDRAVGSKAGLPPLTVEPLFDSLRADARFTALLGRAKG